MCYTLTNYKHTHSLYYWCIANYFVLVDDTGTEVAHSTPVAGSTCVDLRYFVPIAKPCVTYTLREGCVDNSYCGGRVYYHLFPSPSMSIISTFFPLHASMFASSNLQFSNVFGCVCVCVSESLF